MRAAVHHVWCQHPLEWGLVGHQMTVLQAAREDRDGKFSVVFRRRMRIHR